jgi:uncharacterized protein
MKSYIITFIIAILLVGCASSRQDLTIVKIGKNHFSCEVASTLEERATGLMFRKDLKSKTGMLFDLKEKSFTGFWMKNTLIPLDIVWIDEEKNVIDIQTAQPCTTKICETFDIELPARWVLEVNAGEFPGKAGDRVEFDL